MESRLREEIISRMESAPDTRKAKDLQEEILANALEKYQDLLSRGKSPEDAYRSVMDGIGDIESTFHLLEQEEENNMANVQMRKKNARNTAIAIGLYFLAGIVLIGGTLMEDMASPHAQTKALLATIFIAGIATCLLVYNGIVNAPYRKKDDSFAEEYKERESGNSNPVANGIMGVLWPTAVGIFLFTGIKFGSWHINWIIFPIMAGVNALVSALVKRNY